METTTKAIILGSHTDARATNKDSLEDYDERVQIPPGMFNTDPISECVVETVATKVARARPIKVKPTTTPTPTLVSNTYECLANDNNDDEDDDECADRTVEIKEEQQTGKTVNGKNNKKKTNPGRKERDSRGDTDTQPVVVATRELRNTRIKKKKPPTIAVVDLGTMITIH